MPEFHASLNAALARNSGPSAEDVDALADLIYDWQYPEATRRECDDFARQILASDWLAAYTAAAEARGAERGARAVVEAVETAYSAPPPVGTRAGDMLDAAREAAALEGGA